MSVLIESTIKRAKGTKVSIGSKNYHFTPNEHGQHVASVDPIHAKILLAIDGGAYISAEPPESDSGLSADEEAAYQSASESYIALTGKRPHHRWSIEKILEKVAELEKINADPVAKAAKALSDSKKG